MLPNPQYSPLARQTTKYDRKVAEGIIEREGTREAVLYFEKKASKLSDYAYWFYLSTCWVSYTGWSDIQKWKKLFNSKRPDRMKAIMKPYEVDFLFCLPETVTIYRAKRPNEKDWIAYTLSPKIAARFAMERGVDTVHEYKVNRSDILALFLRRGEDEVIVLDKNKVTHVREVGIIIQPK